MDYTTLGDGDPYEWGASVRAVMDRWFDFIAIAEPPAECLLDWTTRCNNDLEQYSAKMNLHYLDGVVIGWKNIEFDTEDGYIAFMMRFG